MINGDDIFYQLESLRREYTKKKEESFNTNFLAQQLFNGINDIIEEYKDQIEPDDFPEDSFTIEKKTVLKEEDEGDELWD